jgi:hypothetical protein
VDALLGDDAQPVLLEDGVDLAGEVPARRVGLMMEKVRSVAMGAFLVAVPKKRGPDRRGTGATQGAASGGRLAALAPG